VRRAGLTLALALAACGKDAPDEGPTAAPVVAPEAPPHLLAVGAPAPAIRATAHDGSTVDLAASKGRWVVVYFYPKDETPGCIVEAEGFRDELPDLTSAGAQVIGVSMDSLDSHRAFAEARGLRFPLLADGDGAIAKAFGVSTANGYAERVTFVIGKDGAIARVFPRVKARGHAAEVLAALR
jgi:peroxiredoxin Q/BCP